MHLLLQQQVHVLVVVVVAAALTVRQHPFHLLDVAHTSLADPREREPTREEEGERLERREESGKLHPADKEAGGVREKRRQQT